MKEIMLPNSLINPMLSHIGWLALMDKPDLESKDQFIVRSGMSGRIIMMATCKYILPPNQQSARSGLAPNGEEQRLLDKHKDWWVLVYELVQKFES